MFSQILTLSTLAISLVSAQAPPYLGQLLIQPGNSAAKCLQTSNSNGAAVTLQDCTGASNQLWTFTGGQIKIFGSKCLDVTNGNSTNGNKVQVYSCSSSNANQKFGYTKFGDNHIQWTSKGKCLDLTGGKLTNGNKIQIWSCTGSNANQVWNLGYSAKALPSKSENGQFGTNSCGSGSSSSSKCQTAWINNADDFCLWAPPNPNSVIGDTEREEVAWCTKSGRGTRVIPNGTLKGVHFVRTPDYVQVTGVGNFTKINVKKGDSGGELDPHGADGNGNPVGGLVYGNTFGSNLQYHEWTSFISDTEFCFRACTGGPRARELCQHIYDVMGCFWNMPANYDAGKFESCKADDDLPMGVYGTSTWHQGTKPTPAPHPVASSSSCTTFPSITAGALKRDLSMERMVKRVAEPAPSPMITAPPA